MKLDAKLLKKLVQEEINLQTENSRTPRNDQDQVMVDQVMEAHFKNLRREVDEKIANLVDSIEDEAQRHWGLRLRQDDIQRRLYAKLARYFTGMSSES